MRIQKAYDTYYKYSDRWIFLLNVPEVNHG